MTTKDYIKTFNLDKKNIVLNTGEFIKALDFEFLEKLLIVKNFRENNNLTFSFHIFQNLVKEMNRKFWAISNKKVGVSFNGKLYSEFYTKVILKYRQKYFPEEHEKLLQRKAAIVEELRIKKRLQKK